MSTSPTPEAWDEAIVAALRTHEAPLGDEDHFVQAVMRRVERTPQWPATGAARASVALPAYGAWPADRSPEALLQAMKARAQRDTDRARWTALGLLSGCVLAAVGLLAAPLTTPDLGTMGLWLAGTLVAVVATSTAALNDAF